MLRPIQQSARFILCPCCTAHPIGQYPFEPETVRIAAIRLVTGQAL
jgi:hypothetical protein